MMREEPDYFPCDECKPLFQGLVDDFLEVYSHVSKQLAIAREALEEILTTATTLPDYPEDAKEIERKAIKALDKIGETR